MSTTEHLTTATIEVDSAVPLIHIARDFHGSFPEVAEDRIVQTFTFDGWTRMRGTR